MKPFLRRIGAEWEKALFWVSVVLLVGVIVYRLAGLLKEGEGDTTAPGGAQSHRSLLNEGTAFAFLQPDGDAAEVQNPFAFASRLPPQAQAEAKPAERRAWRRQKAAEPPPPAPAPPEPAPQAQVAEQKPPEPAPPPPAPPAPKRTVSIAYRGVYKGGDEPTRQLAFLSSQSGEGGGAAMAVAGVGQAVAGVTVKSFDPQALVVTAPTGEEVSIAIGQQKKITLE